MVDAYQQQLAQLIEVPDPPVPQGSSPLTEMSAADARKNTLICLAFGLPSAAGSAALFTYGHWFWGSLVGLFALFWIAGAIGKKNRVAACPYCSAPIVIVLEDRSDPLQCERCYEYSALNAGRLGPLDPDTISETPRFETPLFENSRWPRACVACGAAPTRLDATKGRSLSAGHLVVGRETKPSRRSWHVTLHRGWLSGARVLLRPLSETPHRAQISVDWDSRLANALIVLLGLAGVPVALLLLLAGVLILGRILFTILIVGVLAVAWLFLVTILAHLVAYSLALLVGNEFDSERRARLAGQLEAVPFATRLEG